MHDANAFTVPPPQMVEQMRLGNVDGYCAGEPWNARAVQQGVGVTAATSQDIWPEHPEKVLGCTAAFAHACPNSARAATMALLEASRWIEASANNKRLMAETIAQPAYVDSPAAGIAPRILGHYDNGLGRSWQDAHSMSFFDDGAVNFPYLRDGMWFLTQHKRWGLLNEHPDYLAVARQINRIDLYTEAAGALGIGVPAQAMRSSRLIDGVIWDGSDPKAYADGFALHGPAACRLQAA